MTPLPQSRLDEIRALMTDTADRPFDRLVAARDLLAEVDRLRAVVAASQSALDWMRTQFERVVMTGQVDMKEIAMVAVERDRLREALEKIRDDAWCGACDDQAALCGEHCPTRTLRVVAREALDVK